MTTEQKLIKNKIGLLSLAEELGNVSRACKVMGFSRDTFYRYQELVSEGGIENLIERTRRKPNIKNRIDEKTEAAVVGLGRPEIFALGAATGTPALRMSARAISLSGMRMPTVSSPPVMLSGTAAVRFMMSVIGPGQNAASSFSAISGTSAAMVSSMERSAIWRMSGLSEGRPFAA